MSPRILLSAATAALAVLVAATPRPALAQGAPHAWLFGAWTGGLFPPPTDYTAAACLAQPTMVFTRDVVLRATLTETVYTQRVVDTARTVATGSTDFQFSPAQDPGAATGNGLLGLAAPKPAAGFGCEDDNVLHVVRISESQIRFPGCTAFPYPLVRCSAGH